MLRDDKRANGTGLGLVLCRSYVVFNLEHKHDEFSFYWSLLAGFSLLYCLHLSKQTNDKTHIKGLLGMYDQTLLYRAKPTFTCWISTMESKSTFETTERSHWLSWISSFLNLKRSYSLFCCFHCYFEPVNEVLGIYTSIYNGFYAAFYVKNKNIRVFFVLI